MEETNFYNCKCLQKDQFIYLKKIKRKLRVKHICNICESIIKIFKLFHENQLTLNGNLREDEILWNHLNEKLLFQFNCINIDSENTNCWSKDIFCYGNIVKYVLKKYSMQKTGI